MAIHKSSKAVRKWLKNQKFHFSERALGSKVLVFKAGIASKPQVFRGYDVCIMCGENDVQSTLSRHRLKNMRKFRSS